MRKNLLFIDLDNRSLSLRKCANREFDAGEAIEAAGGWTVLKAAKAYADFQKIPEALARHLKAHSIECVHVPTLGNGPIRKDQVDQYLGLDIADAARMRGIKEVTLASGDCDLVAALSRVIQSKKQVRLLAVRGALSGDLAGLVGPEKLAFLKGGKELSDAAAINSRPVPVARMVNFGDAMRRAK